MKIRHLTYLDFLEKARKYPNILSPATDNTIQSFLPKSFNTCFWPALNYIIDYHTVKYVYLSPQELFLGYSASFLMDAGPEFFVNKIHPEDFEIINTNIFPGNLDYLSEHRVSPLANILFTMTYRLQNSKGIYRQVGERLCVLSADKDGNPLLAAVSLMDITAVKKDLQVIHTIENTGSARSGKSEGLMTRYHCPTDGRTSLSKREIDILKWACDGCSSKLIANKLHLSIHTVNNHRKNMLHKSRCKNITELLNHSIKNGII
jgi:DNA-binding CsgD family transcriptional regulator